MIAAKKTIKKVKAEQLTRNGKNCGPWERQRWADGQGQ